MVSAIIIRPDLFNPMLRLSIVQRREIEKIISGWVLRYSRGITGVDFNRDYTGRIKTWSRWSNNEWVNAHASEHRAEMFARHGEIHIAMMLHWALPPFWHLQPRNNEEVAVIESFGYWKDTVTWVPPEIVHGRKIWVKKNG